MHSNSVLTLIFVILRAQSTAHTQMVKYQFLALKQHLKKMAELTQSPCNYNPVVSG